ncbi:MAG: sorbosone dehydrogenase family protein [Bryobacteraceae bacterium]|nr:sorbosone dehydrogenase family protein [Bryobacteraceae bacterium]
MRSTTFLVAPMLLAGAALAWQTQRAAVKLPSPFATPSVRNGPQVVDRPDGARLSVPEGFKIDEFATGFDKPRIMLYAPGGEILVTEAVEKGSVAVMTGKDGKPLATGRKLIEGLDKPYGMAWWKDYLYVAESTSVKRYKYDAKAVSVGKGEEIISMKEIGKGHWTRTIAFDPKGEKLYLGIGSASNVSTGEPEQRAAISRYNPDGSGYELFATGTRNPTSIYFQPGTGQLWASVQERDELGDELVPDYLTHIQQGGFYGWPYAYFGPNEDPRSKGQKPDLVAKTITPDVSLGAHVAVIDWKFSSGKQFPARYQNGVFAALHGSWNRSKRVGYSVVFVPFVGNKPAGEPQPFLTGWMMDPDKREVWGRPTGLLTMKDGSLLVSDDGGNKIWRISYNK